MEATEGEGLRPASARTDREYFDAIDPGTGKRTASVAITHRRMRWVARGGMGRVKEMAECVSEVLAHPKAVFEGIRWDKDEDDHSDADGWRCYSGFPSKAFHKDGQERTAYEDEVLIVFVNTEGVAYNWRWEDCHPDNPGLPEDCQDRFCKQVYP